MSRRYLFPLLLMFVILAANASLLAEEEPLPIGLTAEEMTRLHEIGMNHTSTAPPTGEIRNPSEWEPMQGVIIRYPFGISYDIIAEMSEDIMVTTIVSSTSQQSTVTGYYQSNGVNMDNVDFLIAATNSYWTRDYGPWFIFEESGDLGIVDHIYNRPRPLDDVIPAELGAAWGLNVFGMDLETTGGNHMSDGLGMSMSTRLVWDENTGLTHDEIDSIMLAYLGNEYTVLEYIESSGIHHIDCWAKFLDPATILVKDVPTSSSSYDLLNDRAEQLSQIMSPWGRPYEVVRVYCPYGTAYTNSIILNDKVLVPTFSSSWDAVALQTYQDAMPGYEILGFTGSWLDDDAIHCRTMGVPDSNMLFIDHVPLALEQTDTLNDYRVEALIVDHSDSGLIMDSCKVYYSINEGAWQSAPLTATATADVYEGYIPAQTGLAEVRYYLQAADSSGRVETHPFIGEPGAHAFQLSLPPDMLLPITEFADSLQPDDATTAYLPVKNEGTGLLTLTFTSEDAWLTIDESEQTLYPDDSLDFEIVCDADGLACGDHSGSISYVSNDPEDTSGTITFDLHIYAPDVYVAEDSIGQTLATGDTTSYLMTIENNGPGRLDYEVACQMFASPPLNRARTEYAGELTGYRTVLTSKGDYEEAIYSAVPTGYGGPDTYGHSWVDSDEGAGVAFDWVDISTLGTEVSLGDDEATAAIPIGFGFPFYDSVYTELYIGSNGIVTFDEPSDTRVDLLLPDTSETALLAILWDDLDPRQGGYIRYYYDSAEERFIVSFDGIKFYSGSSGTGSLEFQAVLHPDGTIKLQYGTLDAGSLSFESLAIGIQNSSADDGLPIVYHTAYLHSDLAIEITAEHWLSAQPAAGSVDGYSSVDITVSFDATNMEDGDYAGQMVVASNDPDAPSTTVAVGLTVSSESWVCGDADGNGVAPDIADLVYLVTYMFQEGPEPPVLEAVDVDGNGVGPDIADLVYLVSYMFQEGEDLNCP